MIIISEQNLEIQEGIKSTMNYQIHTWINIKDCDALLLYTNEQLLQFPWYVLKILSPNTSFLSHFRGHPHGSATAISPVLVSPSLINSLTRASW